MGKLAKGVLGFLRQEVVLSAAIVLAAASAFLVPPDAQYFSYIDWDTLALLFGLMAVMQGFQKAGLFVFLGSRLLRRAATVRGMLFVLVFLPFVCSMVITNDVSLITFVPFGITVLRMAGKEKLLVPMAVLQTAAANLGSVLTPMGNPQNLYLYTRSAMGFGEFCWLMLPYTAVSALCLAALVWCRKREPVSGASAAAPAPSLRSLLPAAAGFLLCLLALFDLLPAIGVAAVAAVFLLAFDRPLLARVDYSLLATFAAFFIFTGNLGRLESFRDFLFSILEGRVEGVAVLVSQVISNVPAALLLSGFTQDWPALIVGCNLGGLGTLIASMASLISYKQVGREYPGERRRYFFWFTLCNIGLLAVLLGTAALL